MYGVKPVKTADRGAPVPVGTDREREKRQKTTSI